MSSRIRVYVLSLLFLTSCTSNLNNRKSLEETLQKNPEILTLVIESHPVLFLSALQNASRKAQEVISRKQEATEQDKIDEYIKNPLAYSIRKDEAIQGEINAPITIVEYSDFECPFCARSFGTIKQLLERYQGKVRIIYKHLPLEIHPNAMISAKYFEAIRLQDVKKAFNFHDLIHSDQRRLRAGEEFLISTAKKVGADLIRLKRDLNSKVVLDRIAEDTNEARSLGIEGTPGFLVNGVPIKGAYPLEHIVSVIERIQTTK